MVSEKLDTKSGWPMTVYAACAFAKARNPAGAPAPPPPAAGKSDGPSDSPQATRNAKAVRILALSSGFSKMIGEP